MPPAFRVFPAPLPAHNRDFIQPGNAVRDFWEKRYREAGHAYGTRPNRFLCNDAPCPAAGDRVLVIGDGQGRNGVWLAERGCEVVSVDFARAGLERAEALAAERGVAIETVHADLLEWDWPENAFDAVVEIFVHFPPQARREVHRRMVRSLRPGGQVILEAFHPDQLDHDSGGPPVAELLYSESDLADDFRDLEIEHLETRQVELDEGPYHQGPAKVVRMIARKGRGRSR